MGNPRLENITGQRFGGWRVFSKAGNTPRGAALWLCRCDCGTERIVVGTDLRNGKSTGCGCKGTGRLGEFRRTHGETGTRLYTIWKNMRQRCMNQKNPHYPRWGGRGIRVCPEWTDFSTFKKWASRSGYAFHLSIDRIDNDGDYEPANCRWVTAAEQSANRRFVSKDDDGVLWWHRARENGITWAAYSQRKAAGWPMEDAVTLPLGTRRRRATSAAE